jgi:hypothetical protein
MPRWTLQQGDLVLGVIDETERDMWNVRATFAPTAAFDAGFESLFAEKAALGEQLEDDDDDDLAAQFDDLEERTSPPHFQLVGEDGRTQEFGFLYVTVARAGFRLV